MQRLQLVQLITLLFVVVLVFSPISYVAAQTGEQCFPETQQCVSGRFRQYWTQNGGLPVFGFPITGAANEANRDTGQTYLTQWFERNRFELHPENQAPYDVLLGRLGDDRLRQQGRDWQTFPKADPSAPHYFAQTGHAIAHEPFWQYWRAHGLDLGDRGISERESLALFGFPISEPAMETNESGDTVLTRWFERARFEYHPNNPDPYKVLLGLLGNEVRAKSGPAPQPSPTPAPSPMPSPLPPSFNNCQADPRAGEAPNFPVRIVTVRKAAEPETVELRNVSTTPIDLTGWRICSIRGNQIHATLSGILNAGETRNIPSQASGSIWSNSEDDDGALYDANGSLVSYWNDPTQP